MGRKKEKKKKKIIPRYNTRERAFYNKYCVCVRYTRTVCTTRRPCLTRNDGVEGAAVVVRARAPAGGGRRVVCVCSCPSRGCRGAALPCVRGVVWPPPPSRQSERSRPVVATSAAPPPPVVVHATAAVVAIAVNENGILKTLRQHVAPIGRANT